MALAGILDGISAGLNVIGSTVDDYKKSVERRKLWGIGAKEGGYVPGIRGSNYTPYIEETYTPNPTKQLINSVSGLLNVGSSLTSSLEGQDKASAPKEDTGNELVEKGSEIVSNATTGQKSNSLGSIQPFVEKMSPGITTPPITTGQEPFGSNASQSIYKQPRIPMANYREKSLFSTMQSKTNAQVKLNNPVNTKLNPLTSFTGSLADLVGNREEEDFILNEDPFEGYKKSLFKRLK